MNQPKFKELQQIFVPELGMSGKIIDVYRGEYNKKDIVYQIEFPDGDYGWYGEDEIESRKPEERG